MIRLRFRILAGILFGLPVFVLHAQKYFYPIRFIPEDLKKDADAVVRLDQTQVNIKAEDEMEITYTRVISIMNRDGEDLASFVADYDPYTKIKDIKITVYNATGRKVRSIPAPDIHDIPAVDRYTLYTDSRKKYYFHKSPFFPYTIRISYKIQTSNTAFLPKYYPLTSYRTSVQKSKYLLTHPANIKVRYYQKKSALFDIRIHKNATEIRCMAENIPALTPEEMSPSLSEMLPYVYFAPERFSLMGVKGTAKDWKSFGDWFYKTMLSDRGKLPASTRNEIRRLTSGIKDPRQKVKKIYEYMQNKTRYVSIQIGIGGWRPMDATEVDTKEYGDCKALVNYTKSLLDVAGIPSYLTAIYGGDRRDIVPEPVGIQGNHAVLMVPLKRDTVWLECTDPRAPFDFLGDFTGDRNGLAIIPGQTHIVRTPRYTRNDRHITALVEIGKDLGLKAQLNIRNCGLNYNDVNRLETEKPERLKTYFKHRFDHLPQLQVSGIRFTNEKDKVCFTESLQISTGKYLEALSGNEYFFRPNLFSVNRVRLRAYPERKFPLKISRGFVHVDSLTFVLPPGFSLGELPAPKTIRSEFGTYRAQVKRLSGNRVLYVRRFRLKSGTYPPEKYADYRKFIKKIRKADKLSVIIKKQ